MAGNVTGLHRFADDVGPVPLSLLDTNFDALTQAMNTLSTYSNYYVDIGTTNALTITVPSTQNVSYSDGLRLLVKVAASNTGPATLNIGSLGPQPIQTAGSAALVGGELQAGSITTFIYNAARNAWQLQGGGGGGSGGGAGTFTTPFTVNDTAGQSVFQVRDGAAAQAPGTGIVTMSPGNGTDPATVLVANGMSNYPVAAFSAAASTNPNVYMATFSNPGSSSVLGCSNGIWIAAGTNASDHAFIVENAASVGGPGTIENFMIINGDGSGRLGPGANQLVWDNAGHFNVTGTATLPGGGTGGATYLSQLLDVAISGQTNGQVLTWSSSASKWVNLNVPPGALAALTDVTLSAPTSGQFLSYNGARWINVPAPAGSGGGSPFTAPFYIHDSTGGNLVSVANPTASGSTVTLAPGNAGIGTVLTLDGAVNATVMNVLGAQNTAISNWLASFHSGTAVGFSNGVFIQAGTNASDLTFMCEPVAAGYQTFVLRGDGTGFLGAAGPSGNNMAWNSSGFTFTTTNPAVQPITVVTPPSTTPGNWLWQVGTGATPSGSSPGCSNGMAISAGTNASDSALKVMSDGETKTFLNLKGDGSGTIGPASSWDVNGVWTFGPTGTGVQEIIRGSPHTTQGLWKFQIGGGPSGDSTDCSNGLYVGAGTSANDVSFWVQNDAGSTTFLQILGTGAVYMPAVGTTATAANVVMDGTHQVLTSTSAARFKSGIRSVSRLRARETVRRLRAVSYHSRCAADDPSRTHYGLIAEEVAEVDPNLVTWDSEGKPQGVQYERIAMLLLPLVQELLA